jgi:hypothetical protein
VVQVVYMLEHQEQVDVVEHMFVGVVVGVVVEVDHMVLQGFGLVGEFRRIQQHVLCNHIFLQMHCRKFLRGMKELLKFQACKYNILMHIQLHIHHQF